MPGIARQFEPHVTRSGGTPSKYRFTLRCSGCHTTDIYEASRATSDDVVKGYFKERGWLLGRDRAYDLCPSCLAKPRNLKPPQGRTEGRHATSGAPQKQPDHMAPHTERRHRDTADILARHLGKPEALAAEVFRPKELQPPGLSAPEPQSQPSPAPALSPEVEQAFAAMAADLRALRSALELMTEQVSTLVALGGQQVEAIARLAPLVARSADGISEGLREIASAIQTIPRPLSSSPAEAIKPAVEARKGEEQPARQLELLPEVDEAIRSESEPAPTVETRRPSRQGRPSKKNEVKAPQAAPAPVVVKSIPDARRSDRFYTTIRLPRALWDKSGFNPEDRLQIDWTKTALSITRVSEGGVRPKSIGEAVVVLQSWRLGELNFDPANVTAGEGFLRLTSA